ncbi:spore germination protein [Cohnella sp. JJ-181]|uniref:spore germination protein n=1 Tax=Cohnella rhizoplanae TaxID=2974897 RepID=UPI0022FF662B|nr:spore germination protein [Cohnella sp. JJ-181]CAI6085810.1 Spore germination protein B1 [Cohnella sp. JJ-181]
MVPIAADRLSKQLPANLARLGDVYKQCGDLEIKDWRYGPDLKHRAASVYFKTICEGNTNYMKSALQDLSNHVIGPGLDVTPEMIRVFFGAHGVSSEHATLERDWSAVDRLMLQGYLVLLIDGWDYALCFESEEMETRPVAEPETEPVVQGPREGTVESLKKNIGMIRKRMQTPALKIQYFRAGGHTNTNIAYGYLEGVVDPAVLAEFERRLQPIRGRGDIVDTSYIEEIIEDRPLSPFPQFRYTERTDTAAAAMLNGKIVLLTEGSGSIMICPGLFFDLLQSSEDYYQRVLVSNFIRWLRFIALMIAISLPSLYIAVSTFHTELIPTVLLLAIVDSREGIPFGAFVEAVIMVFFFELLKEAGIRLPRNVGSAVSIVGALVIGEAAINAGIASPIMVVIVSLTGIASFSLPQYNLSIALRLIQFPLMALSSLLGGFGILLGYLFIWLHLVTLTSLGVPFLTPLAPWKGDQLRDTLIRTKLPALIKRPRPPRST